MRMINRDVFVEQEISTYEMKLRTLNELKDAVDKATKDLEASYLGIVRAKNVFMDIKKENLDELRRYKLAVETECKEIGRYMDLVRTLVKSDEIKNIHEFAAACERLNALQKDGFFNRVGFITPGEDHPK
jgi:hypothetical protein